MNEYFVVANSFAAPFFSDTDEEYIKGESPLKALQRFVKKYNHPAGLYAANLYKSADAYHKGIKRLAYYLSNAVIQEEELTKGLGGYTILHSTDEKGEFIKINDVKFYLINPKEGVCFLVKNRKKNA